MTRPDPEPSFMVMMDFAMANPADHPTWGAIDSWIYRDWSETNPARGVYNWDFFDNYITDNWDDYGKKTAISINLMTVPGADATPTWVYPLEEGNRTKGWPCYEDIDPDPAVNEWSFMGIYCPGWNGAVWNREYKAMVMALGARYNLDARVHSVFIMTGVAGETNLEGMGNLAFLHQPKVFFKLAVDWYDEAFPDKPLFLLHSGVPDRKELALYCKQHNVCSKMNVFSQDTNNHTINPPWGVSENGTAEIAFYATQTLGNWMGHEHG